MLGRVVDALGPAAAVETRLEIGPAAARLVAVAETEDAELLVLGRRDRGAFEAALLGSVSAEVASRAPCPVMIVPSWIADRVTAVLDRGQLEIEAA
jgi:nucleotide-binding universal stress UspA family protein